MKLSLPIEPVIYYECSYGKFRLSFHIPPEQLDILIAQKKVSPKVLEDFPDGVDLNCIESRFAEFQDRYGYRPPLAPESIHRAFLALLSSTRDWKNFRGAGFVPVKDVERFVEQVDAYLEQNLATDEHIPGLPDQPTLEQRRTYRDQRLRRESVVQHLLEQVPLEGIDPDRSLKNQQFSSIEMSPGVNAAEFFSELQRTRGRR